MGPGSSWSGRLLVPGARELGQTINQAFSPMLHACAGHGHELAAVAMSSLDVPSYLPLAAAPRLAVAAGNIHSIAAAASGSLAVGAQYLQAEKAPANAGLSAANFNWPISGLYSAIDSDKSAINSPLQNKKPISCSSSTVVGWPPVQSFRKNSLVTNAQSKLTNDTNRQSLLPPHEAAADNLSIKFVKVFMDGVPVGRKVDLMANNSYDKLSGVLQEMFHQFVTTGNSARENSRLKRERDAGKQPNLFGTSEFVITYEDKDGDLMLVGDVPWSLFESTVKRLRIMKAYEAVGCDRVKDKAPT